MKKKIFSKVISFTLVIAMLSSFATISAFAEGRDDVEANQETISTYSNDVAGIFLRSIFCGCLYHASPSFTNSLGDCQLKQLSYVVGGEDFMVMVPSFYTENFLVKMTINFEVIVANKKIWTEAMNKSNVDSYILLNVAQIILTMIAARNPDVTQEAHAIINNNLGNISNATSLKKAINQMGPNDLLVYVPWVVYLRTILGAIQEPQLDQPGFLAILKDGKIDVPDNYITPDWVNNGAPVHFVEAY